MSKWYQQHEQSAGKIRLEILWYVYKLCGIRFLKIVVYPVALFIALFARGARQSSKQFRKILNDYQKAQGLHKSKFSSVAHIYAFACSIIDKMSASCDKKRKIKFAVNKNKDWDKFQKYLTNNTGVFLICSHLGNIEALSAFPDAHNKTMHAFMQISQNSVFHEFMTKHNIAKRTILHPAEDINLGTASQIYDVLQKGDLVMMAGDRTSPKSPSRYQNASFLGKNAKFPIGTFKFARAESSPVFAVCLMNTEKEKYALCLKELDPTSIPNMVQNYASFLEKLVVLYPKQWFNFFDFFDLDEKSA